MADTPQTLSLVAVAEEFGPVIRQKNRESATFFLLEKRRGSGKNISFVAENDGIWTGSGSETADITNFGSDSQDSATLQWAIEAAAFRTSDLALAAAGSASTPEENTALLARNVVNAAGELTKRINGLLFTGSGVAGSTHAYAGLNDVIGVADNTYAGLDRNTKTFWAPYVVGSTPEVLTKDLIRYDLAQIKVTSGRRPQLAACHPDVFVKVANLFEDKRRFVQDVTHTGQIVLGETGGIPVVVVDGCLFYEEVDGYAMSSPGVGGFKTGDIYYLNRDLIHLEYLPIPEAPAGFFDMDVNATDFVSVGDFGYYMAPLARTGLHKKMVMASMGQLVVERPNAFGKRSQVIIDV